MKRVRRLIKIFLSYLFFYSGLLRIIRRMRRPDGEFRILMYHHITENGEGGLPVSIFEKQISWVRKNYPLMSLKELLLCQKEGREIPKRTLAVTFDDGYRDFLTGAYPILKEKGVPVTLFTVVECLNHKPLWTESVKYWFEKTLARKLDITLNGEKYSFPLENTEEKTTASARLKEHLKHVKDEERQTRLLEIQKKLLGNGEAANMPSPMLNWEEILELARDGVEIGAHTLNHPILSRVSLSEARRQIVASKESLEQRLKKTVHLFSYPNGKAEDFTEEIKEIVQESGFLGACTTIEGRNDPSSDLYALKRIATWERSLPIFACDLAGCFDFLRRGE